MLKKIFTHALNNYKKGLKGYSQRKIFCVGRNKTGTTSVKKAFKDLGFVVGNQRKAELLLPYYKEKNFTPIIEYCKSAEAFQDFPFSFPDTYRHLDEAFPNSKFILTIRNNAEEWYYSLTSFHGKFFGNGKIPTATDLQRADYVFKGWAWECNRLLYQTPEDDPYNKAMLIKHYLDHNEKIINYFRGRPYNFLVLNLAEKESYKKFCNFLEIESPFTEFPWENKTNDL